MLIKFFTLFLLLLIGGSQGAFGACKKIPNMPTARRHSETVLSADGRIFVMGGFDADDHYTDLVEAYNPATNQWTKFVSFPKDSFGLGSIAGVDGLIYVFGISLGRACVLVFDPNQNKWQQRQEMPFNKARNGSSIVRTEDGKIWLFGGRTSTGIIYDSKKDSWEAAAKMNTSRTNFGLVTLTDGRFFASGGASCYHNPPLKCENDELYDPKTDEWTVQNSRMINSPQSVSIFKANDGRIFAIPNDSGNIFPIEVYDTKKQSWSMFLYPRDLGWGFSAVQGQDGIVYLFGAGVNKRDDRGYYSTALGHVNTFNPNTGEWCGQ